MEGQIQKFNLTEGQKAIESMKQYTSFVMNQWQEALRSIEYPEDIDYDSKEEYEAALKEFTLEIIDDIKDIKRDIFSGVLDSYNQFLAAKNQFETIAKKEKEEHGIKVKKAEVDLKMTGIVCLTISLMFPQSIPLIIVMNMPRVLIEMMEIKKGKSILSKNLFVEAQIKEIQNPFFDFTDQLRTDYHESNKKLDDLKKRVIQGENVEQELLEMFDTQKLSLPSLPVVEKNKILEKK